MSKANENNKITTSPLDSLSNQQRIDIIIDELVHLKSKSSIIKDYQAKWNCSRRTIEAIINEAILWLQQHTDYNRENIRNLNGVRLDTLLGSAKTLRDKIKIIDMLNKTYCVYNEQNINLANKDEEGIKFDIGLDDNKK